MRHTCLTWMDAFETHTEPVLPRFAADVEGKSKILAVMLERVVLKKDGESFFFWHEPFNTLFTLGTFINKGKMG